MSKAISSAMRSHLAEDVTTLASAWIITRGDREVFRFTTHIEDVTADFGIGEGEQTYVASAGYSRSNVQNDAELNVNNIDVSGIFDDESIKEADLRAGLFDFAEVRLFLFNYEDTGDGPVKMLRGFLGEVITNPSGSFSVELRSLEQVFTKTIAEFYTPDCRADLGDLRCRLPILPPEVERETAYAVGDFVRVNNSAFTDLTVTNPDAETGDTTGWTDVLGSLDVRSASPAPFEGSFYFFGGANAETRSQQDVAVPGGHITAVDAEERNVRLSWYQNSFAGSDTAEMEVEFLDAGGASLGTAVGAGLTAPVTWTRREVLLPVPELTRTIRISQHMVRNAGGNNDGYIDDITLALVNSKPRASDTDDRIYQCTTAGTTDIFQPAYDTTVSNTTMDGTAVFTAEESWTRAAVVSAVSGSEPKRVFTVMELTPVSGGPRGGFPNDWFNFGGCTFETGANEDQTMEVRDFAEGASTQDITLFLDMPFPIQVGDELAIFPGCDKLLATCSGKFDNEENFVGEAHVPGSDYLGTYPDAR